MCFPKARCRRSRLGVLSVAVVVSLVVGSCTSSSEVQGAAETTQATRSGDTSETPLFCDAVEAAFRAEPVDGDDKDALDAALELAPEELSTTVEGIRAANQDNPSEQDMGHIQDLLEWVGVNCNTTLETVRYIAPPVAPTGFVSCGNLVLPFDDAQALEGSTVMYGDASLDDPFGGDVVSVVTGLLIGPGDAPSTDVTVGGIPAVTGPAGFFQGGGGPASTRVVAWEVEGVEVTVIGRGFDDTRADALVELAEQVELTAGQATLPAGVLDVLYSGSLKPLEATAPFTLRDVLYSASYQRPDGLGILSVSSMNMTAEEFNATRAFLVGSLPRTFHGHDGFAADGWDSEAGPFVAAWWEPDDVAVWVSGLGVAKDLTIAVAEDSVDLTSEQWNETTRFSDECSN